MNAKEFILMHVSILKPNLSY